MAEAPIRPSAPRQSDGGDPAHRGASPLYLVQFAGVTSRAAVLHPTESPASQGGLWLNLCYIRPKVVLTGQAVIFALWP